MYIMIEQFSLLNWFICQELDFNLKMLFLN